MSKSDETAVTLKRDLRNLRNDLQRLDARVFDLTNLLHAQKAFDNVLDEKRLHEIFANIVQERFGPSTLALFVADDAGDALRLACAAGLPSDFSPNFSFPRREGLLWQAMAQGAPFTVVDPRGRPRFRAAFERNGLTPLAAELFVPVTQADQIIGVLAIGAKRDGAYSETDCEFLSALAARAAAGIRTARVYQKSQRDKAHLDKTVKNLSMLYNIGRAMVHITDLKNLLKFILGEAIRTTEAQKGSLMLFDSTIGRLVVRVVQGLPDPHLEEAINNGEVDCASFASGEGIAGQVFQTRKVIIANATSKDERYAEREKSNVDSILCIPLIASDEPIGVINITNKKTGKKFTTEDVELLTALGNQAAVAINNATLYEMAITDELTKLFIRRYFNVRLETELKRSARYGREMSLAICDLDQFKRVNDEHGHQIGDATLVAVAEAIRTCLRTVDAAARFGGDEFAIIFPETGEAGARAVAERLRETVANVRIEGLPRPVAVSIGLAVFPEHAEDSAAIIRAADAALYEAKRQGRNCVCIYHRPHAAALA